MDLRKLKKLIDLVEESGISELELTEGEEKVKISRNPALVVQPQQHLMQNQIIPNEPQSIEVAEKEVPPTNDKNTLNSPMVGTFYRAASPDDLGYVC